MGFAVENEESRKSITAHARALLQVGGGVYLVILPNFRRPDPPVPLSSRTPTLSMSTLNPPQRVSRRQELREDQLTTLAAKSWDAFDRNKTIVYGVLGAITLVLAGIIGYYLYINSIEDDAQAALAASLKLYEQGDFRGALDGTADVIGLLDVADDFGSTDAGNLAHYYAADAHFRLGEYEQALDHFDDFSKSDNLIGASAHAGEAAVYEQQGDFSRAGDLYMRAALLFESDVTSPDY